MNPTTRPRSVPKFLAALMVAAFAIAASFSQSPAWRTDYAQARREATNKNKPILLEFVSENCVWCRKLESTTLSDPAVTSLLNEQYIPIKVDPHRDAEIIQRLQISSYPTLLLAAPDGRILTIVEGYVETNKLLTQLQVAVAACRPAPKPRDIERSRRAEALLAQAKADYQAEDYFACLDKCQSLSASFADCPEAATAAKIEADIIANPERLAQACNNTNDRLTTMYMSLAGVWLKKGRPDEAMACLEKLQQLSPKSSHAQAALTKLTQIQTQVSQQRECKKP